MTPEQQASAGLPGGAEAADGFHVMAKPSGARCNLDCRYCFYLDKASLFPPGSGLRMGDEVLEAYVRQQFESQRGPEVTFAWQGGEPTLMGLQFFERVVASQGHWGDGRPVQNTFQTNAVLLDDHWGEFLAREKFLVGVSIDGPRELHDRHRVDKGGRPTFDRVVAGIEILRRHGAEFNTLTVVHDGNVRHPLATYRFLKEIGSTYLQFIPLVERLPSAASRGLGLDHAPPPAPGGSVPEGESEVTAETVRPDEYGEFLVAVFDEWVASDVGRVFVQLFDVSLGVWMGRPAGLCLFRETCGDALALEHNGDVFSCDHFVHPRYRLGNIADGSTDLGELARSPQQRAFGESKSGSLPDYCRRCDVRFACNGECPKNRFATTPDGEPGLNYLCRAYRRFFRHVDPAMRGMAWLAANGRPPAEIMTRGVPRRPQVPDRAGAASGPGG